MLKVFKYSIYNLLRSLWLIIYFLFFLLATLTMISFCDTLGKAVVSMLTIIISIVPLIGLLFGIMYYYSSREFIELLVCQPIRRSHVFAGQLGGLIITLSLCFIAGTGLPFLFHGIFYSDSLQPFLLLLGGGTALTFIFSSFAFLIGIASDNKIKGFGIGILAWLYFAILYDGIFLFSLVALEDYPLEKFSLVMTVLNPVDLARVLVLLHLDLSTLMGYTGAVFSEFFGKMAGTALAAGSFFLWFLLPLGLIMRKVKRKDF